MKVWGGTMGQGTVLRLTWLETGDGSSSHLLLTKCYRCVMMAKVMRYAENRQKIQ